MKNGENTIKKIYNRNSLMPGVLVALIYAAGILLFLEGEQLFQISQSLISQFP